MNSDDADLSRRRFLTATASVVGGVGVVAAAVPFVSYMNPSERARSAGAPVEADISKLEPGQRTTYLWRGKPVWILRRTERMLKELEGLRDQLNDPDSKEEEQQPDYAQNIYRSIKPEILVMVGLCTHLGCAPTYKPEPGGDLGAAWRGGFFCPCHGSRFDLAGRVYSGVPAQLNMEVPKHKYLSETLILIGDDKETEGAAS